MGKYTIHRPAARKSPARPGVEPANRRKPPSGRWVLHDPASSQGSPTHEGHGWHFDGPDMQPGTQQLGQRWTCDYGCKSFVWRTAPEPGQFHAWDCPYWRHEGKDLTPF